MAEQSSAAKHRARQTLINLLLALAASVGIALALVMVVPRDDSNLIKPVDYKAIAESVSTSSGMRVLAPAELPVGWWSNSARWSGTTADGVQEWHIGFVGPKNQYIGVDQAFNTNPTWIVQKLTEFKLVAEPQTVGDYTIDVLWPLVPGFADENPNNVSIAALIRSRDLTLFAAGDIEPPVQERLRGKIGRVDIYKVAHHGSRFQDPVLMRELSPTLALISAGEGNTYGHPAPETIAALEQLRAKVRRTDRDGAIAVAADNHALTITTENSKPHLISWS